MRRVSKLVSSGIGMAAEANAQRKEKKQAEAAAAASSSEQSSSQPPSQPPENVSEQPPPSYKAKEEDTDTSDSEEDDDEDFEETAWHLDDAEGAVRGEDHETAEGVEAMDKETREADEILRNFAARHPIPTGTPPDGQLRAPVIIPQKRPESKARGFVRAYAPDLEGCGIDQDTFLEFLDGFRRVIKYSPVFHAINGAVAIAVLTITIVSGPMITVHAAALAIHTSIETSRRGYIRYQSNKYLDGMNEQLFKPHGLYAMVMAYKPEDPNVAAVDVDISKNIVQSVAKRSDGHHNKLGGPSGKTHGEMELPEAAPLIFPGLDELPDDKKQNAMQKGGAFLRDYFDRRAQAKFEAQNPNSSLNVPRKEFASRYSDPNHPVNQGGIVGVLSGGHLGQGRQRRRERKTERRRARAEARGFEGPIGKLRETRLKGREQGGSRLGLLGAAKKQLKQGVLYLMIVNMPTEEEIREVLRASGKLPAQEA